MSDHTAGSGEPARRTGETDGRSRRPKRPPPRGEHEPKPLGDLLGTLIAGRGWGERMAIGRLRECWGQIVGPQVASRSEPLSLRRGVLSVRALGGAWATELTLLATTVATRAHDFLDGNPPVTEVRVVAGGGLRDGRDG